MVLENSDRVFVHLINVYDEDAAKSQFGKFDVDHKFNYACGQPQEDV